MPGRLGDLLGRGGQQRVDRAEVRGEVAARDLADALDADREQHAARTGARASLDRADEVGGRGLPDALELHQPLGRQLVDVGRRPHEARSWSCADLLLPEAVDVHRAARDPVAEQLPLALRAQAVGAAGEDGALGLDRRGVAGRAAAPAAPAARRRSARSSACGAGETTCGMTSPARRTITSSPTRMSLRAQVLLVVQRRLAHGDAADVDRLQHRERVQVAELADVPLDPEQRRDRGRRRELPGDRPARVAADDAEAALHLELVDLDHDAVDLEVQRAAAVLPARRSGRRPRPRLEHRDVGVDREAVVAQPVPAPPSGARSASPSVRADAVGPERQRPVGGQLRVELADRPRRRVARVHEGRQPLLRAALVERAGSPPGAM